MTSARFNPSYQFREHEEPIAYQEFYGEESFLHCAGCADDLEFPIYVDEFTKEMLSIRCDECQKLITGE